MLPQVWNLFRKIAVSDPHAICIPFSQFVNNLIFGNLVPVLLCLLHDFSNYTDNEPYTVLIPRLRAYNAISEHSFDYSLVPESKEIIVVDVKYMLGPKRQLRQMRLERVDKLFKICIDKVKDFIVKIAEWASLHPCRDFTFVLKLVSFDRGIVSSVKRICNSVIDNLTIQLKRELPFTGEVMLEVVSL